MKKFYAFAAAALCAASFSANATIYLCGAGEGLGWDPATPMTVEAANGAYTLDIDNLNEFKISTAMGDWDTFNAAAIGVVSITKADLGKALPLVDWGENTSMPWKGDYHIVIPEDLSTITLTTDTPEPTGFHKLYFRGDMNNWGNGGAADLDPWELTTTDGVNYKFTCAEGQSIPADTAFKIADADWSNGWNYTIGEAVLLDEEMTWGSGNDNATLDEEWSGAVTFVRISASEAAVTFHTEKSAGVSGVEVEETVAPVYYNLQGVKVANPEKGLYIMVKGAKASKVAL